MPTRYVTRIPILFVILTNEDLEIGILKTSENRVCEYVCLFFQDACSPEFRNDLTVIGANAKDSLMKHASLKSPTRYYGILACILSITEDLAGYIKIVFLEPSVRNVPMNHLVSVIN